MNLHDWSELDDAGKKNWLAVRAQSELENTLAILGEMLEHADDLDAEIAMLPPNEEINNAREFTQKTLRDMERCIVDALVQLKEREVAM